MLANMCCRELLVFVVAAWVQLAQDNRSQELRTIQWKEFINLTIVRAFCSHPCHFVAISIPPPLALPCTWQLTNKHGTRTIQVLAVTQGSGSVALSYVNFPVKVVMKSCKLIPTMALGIFILRRAYSSTEYCAAGLCGSRRCAFPVLVPVSATVVVVVVVTVVAVVQL